MDWTEVPRHIRQRIKYEFRTDLLKDFVKRNPDFVVRYGEQLIGNQNGTKPFWHL